MDKFILSALGPSRRKENYQPAPASLQISFRARPAFVVSISGDKVVEFGSCVNHQKDARLRKQMSLLI